jgi:GNAT superfamily N-acetyltransferase
MIQAIALPLAKMDMLQAEARTEGYDFIETTVTEWASGVNRFNGPGETFCGYFEDGQLVGVGGLTLDPFAGRLDVGRIRRIYVRASWRKRGIGRAIVSALLEQARKGFASVRLRAENADAARLYESMGFLPIIDANASHVLEFN